MPDYARDHERAMTRQPRDCALSRVDSARMVVTYRRGHVNVRTSVTTTVLSVQSSQTSNGDNPYDVTPQRVLADAMGAFHCAVGNGNGAWEPSR